MRRLHRFIAGATLVMTAATPVSARELGLGIDTMLGGDSNILYRSADPTADGVVRLEPMVRVKDETRRFVYDLRYDPSIWFYMTSGVDTRVDHFGLGRFEYRFDPATSVSLNARGSDSTNLGGSIEDPGSFVIGDEGLLTARRQTADVSVTLNHSLSPRWNARVNAGFQYFGFDQFRELSGAAVATEVSNQSGNVTFDSSYVLNSRTSLGLGGYGAYQVSQGERTDGNVQLRPPSTTTVVRLFMLLAHQIDEKTSFSAQVGPSYSDSKTDDVDSSQAALTAQYLTGNVLVDGQIDPNNPELRFAENCGAVTAGACLATIGPGNTQVPDGFQNPLTGPIFFTNSPAATALENWTYYASIRLNRDFSRNLSATASYDRSEFAGAFEGSASILDNLRLTVSWKPDDEWALSGTFGVWLRNAPLSGSVPVANVQDSAGDPLLGVPAGAAEVASLTWTQAPAGSSETRQFNLQLQAAYRINKRMSLGARVEFVNADRKNFDAAGTLQTRSEVSLGRGFVVFRYEFREFRF